MNPYIKPPKVQEAAGALLKSTRAQRAELLSSAPEPWGQARPRFLGFRALGVYRVLGLFIGFLGLLGL